MFWTWRKPTFLTTPIMKKRSLWFSTLLTNNINRTLEFQKRRNLKVGHNLPIENPYTKTIHLAIMKKVHTCQYEMI